MLRSAARVVEAPENQDKPAFDLLIVLNVPEVLTEQVQRRVSTGASVASRGL